MKSCGNKECFFATTAKEILKDSSPRFVALIKKRGVCDAKKCEGWEPDDEQDSV